MVNITATAGQLVEIAEAGTVTCVSGSDLVRPMPCCPGQLLDSYLENTSPPQWHSISARWVAYPSTFRWCHSVRFRKQKNLILEVGMTFRKYHRQTKKITSRKCGAAGVLQNML